MTHRDAVRGVTGGEIVASSDASWSALYRVGAVSAWLFLALRSVAIVLAVATPPPPTTGGAATLEYIVGHRVLYIVHQQLWLVPGLFAAVVYLALYRALRRAHRSYAALGAAVGAVAWALTLATPTTSTGAPALVYLSDQYVVAGDLHKAVFIAAAENLIALNRTPTVVGVMTTAAMLIVSLVMLKSAFPKAIAYLGIATGALGIASETLRPVIEGAYGVYGVLMLVWFGAVGWTLYRLARGLQNEPRTASAGR